ncbi:hypothetical protein Cs7R123_22300 [Catellatospora sp. TT07R-123]|uniref:terminase gpP N-terminus-related DNA-binding protein n=1 Tax=Catellatospora sp. TT07R-123 TaxID=2733863 RepID=UPI001B15A101|nr:transcriptional regulator [Catellatospora sp. TT07R-123]GHJ44888.1 hypothetical protein Cs7R123_22300 [Catellatospora sp. TT07R-123]
MHPLAVRSHARELFAQGSSVRTIALALNIPYQTVANWCHRKVADERRFTEARCPRCLQPPSTPGAGEQYAYLLGSYLGDGHLVLRAKVPVLRVYCADAYPAIMDAVGGAMLAVLANSVQRISGKNCTTVQSYSKHWPCLFPQAGPGRKHERPIVLEPWQEEVVAAHPGAFVRGLFHSDGCRTTNRVTKAGRVYEYPRYLLANESADILALCGAALDRLGIAWRPNRRNSLSVARRDAVAHLDLHVGPKS